MNANSAPPLRTRDGLFTAGFVLLISAVAFAATAHNCSTTDGSFTVTDSAARPSLYCRATDLYPPAFDTAHGIAVCALLFVGPLATVLVATAVCARRRRPLPGRLLVAALIASGLTFVLSFFADVGFKPYA
jgi:hypothetical protein